MLEIMALGSSLRALRCGKGGKAAGQDCHSSKEREGKRDFHPLPQISLTCQQYVTGISFPNRLLERRDSAGDKVTGDA